MTYGAKQLIGKIGSIIGVCLMLAGFIYLNVSFPDKEPEKNYVTLGDDPEIHKPKRYTMSAEKLKVQTHIRNLMRLFIQSLRSYENESGESINNDDREDLEFVDIFLDSEDAFDMEYVYKIIQTQTERERKLYEALSEWQRVIDTEEIIIHDNIDNDGFASIGQRLYQMTKQTIEECKPTIKTMAVTVV